MNSRRKVLYVVVAVFLFFPASGFINVDAQEAEMPFIMAYGSDIGELNPLTSRSQRSAWYDMLVYDTLLSYDEDLNLIPWLAQSWAVSADGLTVNFTIRTGATWHDGVALDANDVEFTFEYIRDGSSDLNDWSFFQNVTSVMTYGNVVSCTFNQLYSFAVETLGRQWIIPEHVRNGTTADNERWDDEDDVAAHTGSGPFKYVERVPDEFTLLERYDDWWGPDNPEVGQLPSIDQVRIDVVLGQDARILAMRQGTADTERYEVFGPYVEEVLGYPELQLVQDVASMWDYVLGFNVTIPGLDDVDVRKAMAMAINREELVNIGRLGYGTETYSAMPQSFFPGLYDASTNFPDSDVAGANALLDAAGYIDLDNDGTRNFPGDAATELEFDIMTLSWDDISVATGDGLVAQMAAINITLHNQVTDDTPMYDAIYTGAYEMYTMGHGYDPTPDHMWWRTHSDNIYEWGDNVYGFVNSTVDDIMETFMSSAPADLPAAATAAAIAIRENVPYIPLYLSDDTHIMRKEWVNYTTPGGGPFTSYNPSTMVFMYDDGTGIVYSPGIPMLWLAAGAAAVVVVVLVGYFVMKRR